MKLKLSFLASIISFVINAQSAPAYYNQVNLQLTGNQLKNQLAATITNTHTTTISYSQLKELMKTSDVDPDVAGNLLLIYGSQSSGTHQRSRSIGGSWNREHVYAKSKGTPNLGTSGPGADGHHLRPADISLNSTRGSLLFDDGIGAMAQKTSRGGWYPGDEWKGDVARILMYMYVRYKDRCKPLNITYGPSTIASDFPDILLKWNVEDPISNFEIQRNNIVANKQGNRNPFIDNPYLATVIWGGQAAQNTWPDSFNGGGTTDTQAPSTPTNLNYSNVTATSATLAWTASTDNFAVASYDVYMNNQLKQNTTTNSANITGLTPETAYSFYVKAKDAAGNISGNSNTIDLTTTKSSGNGDGDGGNTGATCGTETFDNIPVPSQPPASSYSLREWSTNGVIYEATNARTDKQIYIDGDNNKAICIKTGGTNAGALKATGISGGIGSLSLRTKLPFDTDKAGTLNVLVNGQNVGTIAYSKDAKTFTISNINIEGNIEIEIIDQNLSANNRVSLDNLSWTCYTKMATDEVKNADNKIKVYPNPVKNHEIFVEGIKNVDNIEIYNLNGQKVQNFNQVKNKQKLNLNKLPKGIYILKSSTASTKFIVE
ncbi:T9SS type A sorting domain-containing protein [Chryseobacterium sp. POL2]|uniref:endonuclease n=1 Tax=Chryseobacterium sp. POL2 TaxID=2713414 RepID=UPI0013E1E831|nr:endonuclease [Chryseobacterium sp. POL2]QIG90629.1 T9SS type A sorting domain-containing protein [Chryseobacterium sp. POL2]